MNETKSIPQVAPANSSKMLRAMVGLGVLCALMIVLTFEGTLPRIERLRAEALEKAIFKVLPGIVKTETYQLVDNNSFIPMTAESADAELIYAGFDEEDQLVGVAIAASGQGYADILRILYGYDIEKQAIVGMNVLESKETPGLGDKIDKDPAFLENFVALDVSLVEDLSRLKNKVVYVKSGEKKNPWEIDGITGATISSKAIGNMIGLSAERLIPLVYNNKATFIVKKEISENKQ